MRAGGVRFIGRLRRGACREEARLEVLGSVYREAILNTERCKCHISTKGLSRTLEAGENSRNMRELCKVGIERDDHKKVKPHP